MNKITDRLIGKKTWLKLAGAEDKPFIAALLLNAEATRYTRFAFADRGAEGAQTAQAVADWIARTRVNDRHLTVRSQTDGERVGMIAVKIEEHRAEIGFILHPDHWGRGYATDAVRTLGEFLAQPRSGVQRLWAVADAGNDRCVRVLERAGYEREGLLRSYELHPQVSAFARDCHIYSKLNR